MENSAVRKSALIIAAASSFITPFMGSSINIALPSIQKAFHIDAVLLSWIPTSYLLAAAVFLVPFGRLADLYGRKKIYTYGITVFTIMSFLSGISSSAAMLIVFRIGQGIGSAMIFGTGMAILMSVFPPQERGKVLGINVAAVYIGLSLGPFLGGLLTQYFTWRSVFLVNVPLGVLVVGLVFWRLKGEWAEARGEKFDLVGAVIYGLAVIAVIYGITLLPGVWSIVLIVFGGVAVTAFVIWETRVTHPVFELNLFRSNRVFAMSSLAALINYSATFAVTFLISLYLQYIKALTPRDAGVILVAQPVMMALLSPIAGRLSDKIEPRIVASLGMLITTLALFLFVFLNDHTATVLVIGNLALLGVGLALFSSPNTNAIMSSVERRYYGIASGATGTMRLLGQMVSMGIATLIFALFIGRVQITPAYYPVFLKCAKVAFIIFTIMCFAGIFASLARGRVRTGETNSTESADT